MKNRAVLAAIFTTSMFLAVCKPVTRVELPPPADAGRPPAIADSGAWESTDCADLTSLGSLDDLEEVLGVTIGCGYLIVPEDHFDPANTRTLKVAAMVVDGEDTQPPVIYLNGGPGGAILRGGGAGMITSLMKPNVPDRDMIFFDQRGTGESMPALACPEVAEYLDEVLGVPQTADQYMDNFIQAAAQCRDRLESEGVDLDVFTSAQSAQDIDLLRRTLGYESMFLFGQSYGARLGLTALRDLDDGHASRRPSRTVPLYADSPDIHRTSLCGPGATDAICSLRG